MTLSELITKLHQLEQKGLGDKPILVEDGQQMFHIDGIAKNTHPDVEPQYLFFMPGDLYEY